MKKYFIIILSVIVPLIASAQAVSYRDVVELQNGSIIKGIIVEQVPNQTIKIKTADGSLFVFQMNEVTKIRKEEVVIEKKTVSYPSAKGQIGIALGIANPKGRHSEGLPTGNTVSLLDANYRFNQNFGLALKWLGNAHVKDDVTSGFGAIMIGVLYLIPINNRFDITSVALFGSGGKSIQHKNKSEIIREEPSFGYNLGIGARYSIAKHFGLTTNLDFINFKDYQSVDFSVGIAYLFR